MSRFEFRAWKKGCGCAFFSLGVKPMWSGEYSKNHSYYFTGVGEADVVEQCVNQTSADEYKLFVGDIIEISCDDCKWLTEIREFGEIDVQTSANSDVTLLKWFNDSCEIELKGNIHDNPELMEVGE